MRVLLIEHGEGHVSEMKGEDEEVQVCMRIEKLLMLCSKCLCAGARACTRASAGFESGHAVGRL